MYTPILSFHSLLQTPDMLPVHIFHNGHLQESLVTCYTCPTQNIHSGGHLFGVT